MKVLVTGASGGLGSRVVSALTGAGHEVVATDIRAPQDGAADVRVVDLCQVDSVRELLPGVEVVCHLGNLPGMHRTGRSKGFINNTSANYNVFLATTEAGVNRIVYASSIQVYGCFGFSSGDGSGAYAKPKYFPLDEDHPLAPADAYPLSKAVGESIAESFCRANPALTAWSLRYSSIQGHRSGAPGRPTAPSGAKKPSLNAVLGGMCTWIHIDDAVRATVLACSIDHPGHTPVNIVARTAGPTWTRDALVEAFGELPEFRRPVTPDEALIRSDRAEQLLGFRAEREHQPR